jgi:hypothetical protein
VEAKIKVIEAHVDFTGKKLDLLVLADFLASLHRQLLALMVYQLQLVMMAFHLFRQELPEA